MTEYIQAERIQSRKEEREERKNKKLAAILLGLSIVFALMLLMYLLFFKPRVKPEIAGIDWKFSVYGLRQPYAAASDNDNNILVSDTGKHRVLYFDANGKLKREIGGKGSVRFRSPYGALIDDTENKIYIADWTRRRIIVFSKQGKFLKSFPTDTTDDGYGEKGFSPYQMAKYKNNFFVTSNNGVFVFNSKGELVKNFDRAGNDKFKFPNGIAVDEETGNIFITDVLNRRVVSLKQDGKVRWIAGKPDILVNIKKGKGKAGKLVSFFQLPRSVDIGPDGNLYITDTFANQVIILDKDGKLISMVGERGVEDGKFHFPEGIRFRNDGSAMIADRVNNRIQVMNIRPPQKKLSLDKKKLYESQFKKFAD